MTIVGSFISGIKVYAYADEHTPEGKMIRFTYFQMLQAVVIEQPFPTFFYIHLCFYSGT